MAGRHTEDAAVISAISEVLTDPPGRIGLRPAVWHNLKRGKDRVHQEVWDQLDRECALAVEKLLAIREAIAQRRGSGGGPETT